MSSSAIIDIQGYLGLNNQFIPREIAVFYSSNHIQHMFLKSSSSVVVSEDLQWQSNWVYNNYRRFKWNGGCILQYKAINMLLNNLKEVNKVYVKGLIKRKWINNLLTGDCGAIDGIQVINLEENYAIPNIHELKKKYPGELRCNSHNGACALQNVQLLNKIKSNFSF